MQLPLGIFGVALSTVSLPLLARMAATRNMTAFRSELGRGMRLAFLTTIPSAIGLMVLAEPIMSVLYQHGRMNAFQTAQAGAALRFYALGLCGYAALKVLVNAFYALDRRTTPMVVSFGAVGLNLLLNWLFAVRLGFGHRGLALSTACIATTNFLVLYMIMRSYLGRLESHLMVGLFARLALPCTLLTLVCWGGAHYLLSDWATQALLPRLTRLVLTIAAGGAAFIGTAAALRVPEVRDLLAALRRRWMRLAGA
jgi:putative peptidoglycan lipid II flippase